LAMQRNSSMRVRRGWEPRWVACLIVWGVEKSGLER
jgi:hypothetical protein